LALYLPYSISSIKKVYNLKNATINNQNNLKSSSRIENEKDRLKNYLEVDYKIEDEMFDFYVENPKKLNKEIKFQIIKFFSFLTLKP
jgi:transcriptional regulator of NAD metabolism